MNNPADAGDPTIDIRAFAHRVGLSISTVRRAVARGSVPHYRLGRLIRFDERHVREWLARHEQGRATAGEG